MSLLMQALKKAERAKQNAAGDVEVDRPSQEFDDILALTPEPAPTPAADPAATATPAAKRELSLDFEPAFSLEPAAPPAPPAASLTPRPAPDPLPPAARQHESGLAFDLAPDPAAPVAPAAAPAAAFVTASAAAPGTAPAASSATAAPAAAVSAGMVDHGGSGDPAAPRAPRSNAGGNEAREPFSDASTAAGARAAAAAARPNASAKARTTPGARNGAGDQPRARARAAAQAGAEPPGMDPERLRLIGLLTVLALIVLGFGYYYWQAVMAPGAGSRLPPVAMPPPGATGATPVQIVGPGANAGTGAGAVGAADGGIDPSVAGMLAPSSGMPMNRGARDDIERRLERTEQELAAAQQAIQAQAAPRQERLPPVAAPENTEIRVARAVQPARVAPALENAYALLNSGDLANAQQQYEAALRQDGNSRDALLGMATVAARQNQGAQASSYYLRLLELDPNDATAVAGLVSLRGGDAGQSERRLKAILATNTDAGPVLFALGNLYAQQSRWPEAQQTYFRAYTAAPDNADYAYNLAIGLDRLNQGTLALTYYQRALALAQDKAAGFDRTALRQRMHELSLGSAH
jgi:tetratricopeptide (TPR) repeat protein